MICFLCQLMNIILFSVMSVIVVLLNDRSMESCGGWRTGCSSACTHETTVIQWFVSTVIQYLLGKN